MYGDRQPRVSTRERGFILLRIEWNFIYMKLLVI
jgi:hypothetical protein